MSDTVAVHELRVGMYVHLDVGWLAHPFPLSSFRITNAGQIDTIRRLGLQHLRWDRRKSSVGETAPPAPAAPAAAPESAAAAADRARRDRLAAEQEAARRCERQYAEAGIALRAIAGAVVAEPERARAASEALTGALVDKMLVGGDVCIRLLNGDAGDHATAHALNVAVVSLLMGRSFGLERAELLELGVGALLHDVGKINLAEHVRHAGDGLSAAETTAYRDHVAAGVRHGRRMGLAPGALLVIGQHHEHADGSGFPQRVGSDRMSTASRIVALVNRYDNLCNPARPGRALSPHEALSTLFSRSHAQFDATILNAFIRMMGVYPAGSLVQLTDDRYALVVGANTSRPLKPRVLVHDAGCARADALVVDLERELDLGIRRSLSPARVPDAALEFLAPQPRVSYFFEPAPAAELQPA